LNSDRYIVFTVIIMNIAIGFGFAIPIARSLMKLTGSTEKFFRYFAMLIGIYFVECIAFAAGMCTQVFSVGLAFVWGIILGLWLRGRAPARDILKQTFYVSIYGCLPTTSFCILIPVIKFIFGGHILSAAEGTDFGIPDFLPWPLNTILGFFTAILVGTIVFKIIITMAAAHYLIHRKENITNYTCLKGSG
jgi:hypothetical protein